MALQWNNTESMQLAKELNEKGIMVRESISGIYNLFKTDLPNYWTGKNFNNVAEYVNGYASSFYKMTRILATVIPGSIKDITNQQVADGKGTIDNFTLKDDGVTESSWVIPKTTESADGRIRITTTTVKKYFQSSQAPSVLHQLEETNQHLSEYVSSIDALSQYANENDAVKLMIQTATNYQTSFKMKSAEIIDLIIEVANQEISGIEEVDVAATSVARKGIFSTMAEGAASFIENAPGRIRKAGNDADAFVADRADDYKTGKKMVNDFVDDKIDDWKTGANQIKTDTKDFAAERVDDWKTGANDIKKGASNFVDELVDNWKTGAADMNDAVADGLEDTAGALHDNADNLRK